MSQDTFCPGTICLAKICCSWLLMGVDGETFCPGYVFTGKTYCPGTKCLTEVLLLAMPFWVLLGTLRSDIDILRPDINILRPDINILRIDIG